MVKQLESVDLCKVVHLLKTRGQAAHILEALSDQLCSEESQDILVELSDRNLVP